MPGQLSNFMKNFGKLLASEPFIETAKILNNGLLIGGDVFWNLNKLDDPKISDSQKASAIFNASVAPLSVVPVVGPITKVVSQLAPYVTDVIEGRRDAPVVGADVNSKINPIGNVSKKIV
jgi:hypothetical protein